jgi:ATP-dependent helicase HrpA
MNIRVVDARRPGRVLLTSRDLAQIRREFAGKAEQSLVRLPDGPLNRSGVFHWDFGPLPESVVIEHGEPPLTVFPALNDEGAAEDVAIRPFVTAEKARAAHTAGLRRLFFLHTRRECRSLILNMPGIEKVLLWSKGLESAPYSHQGGKGLMEELAELAAQRAWESAGSSGAEGGTQDVRTRERFDARLNIAWTRIGAGGTEVFGMAERILAEHMAIAPLLEQGAERAEWSAAMTDLRVQLAYLFGAAFWTRTPFEWLREYPRYLLAVRRRLDRLGAPDGVARDTRTTNEIAPWVLKLRVRVEQGTPSQRADPRLILYRWMLEEWRVALWGGEGGRQETILPVSAKRMQEQWGRVVES